MRKQGDLWICNADKAISFYKGDSERRASRLCGAAGPLHRGVLDYGGGGIGECGILCREWLQRVAENKNCEEAGCQQRINRPIYPETVIH